MVKQSISQRWNKMSKQTQPHRLIWQHSHTEWMFERMPSTVTGM